MRTETEIRKLADDLLRFRASNTFGRDDDNYLMGAYDAISHILTNAWCTDFTLKLESLVVENQPKRHRRNK